MTPRALLASQRFLAHGSRRRVLFALLALAAIVLCGYAMHAAGGHAHSTEASTTAPNSAAAAPSVPEHAHDGAAVATHPQVAAQPHVAAHPMPGSGAAAEYALAMTCLLVLLTAAVLLVARQASGIQPQLLDRVVWRIDPTRAQPEPHTPTPHELSISRT